MRHRSPRWTCAVSVLVMTVTGAAAPAAAQSVATADPSLFAGLFEATPDAAPRTGAAMAASTASWTAVSLGIVLPGDLPRVDPLPPLPAPTAQRPATRGHLLPLLYAGFGVLQALDAHSTLRAVNVGHREANPVMSPFASQPAAMIGVKAATAAGTIYMVDRLARKHRVAAAVLMVALNGAYAAVVSANYGRPR